MDGWIVQIRHKYLLNFIDYTYFKHIVREKGREINTKYFIFTSNVSNKKLTFYFK